MDIEQSSSEEEIDEFEQLLAMPLKQRKIAQPWQRPNPTNDEQREQERVLAEKEHELGLLIDTYDTRLRELYYMGRFMSMLEYDPVKMKAEKNEMLLAVRRCF